MERREDRGEGAACVCVCVCVWFRLKQVVVAGVGERWINSSGEPELIVA